MSAVEVCLDQYLNWSVPFLLPPSATTPTLKHRLQRNIAAVQWKPLCASALAVACQNCLLVWHVDPCSLSTRCSVAMRTIFFFPNRRPGPRSTLTANSVRRARIDLHFLRFALKGPPPAVPKFFHTRVTPPSPPWPGPPVALSWCPRPRWTHP